MPSMSHIYPFSPYFSVIANTKLSTLSQIISYKLVNQIMSQMRRVRAYVALGVLLLLLIWVIWPSSKMGIVYPIISCASLTRVNITDIGDNGSSITSAEETTSQNITMCTVKGVLAPAIHFQVNLPLKTWTQRYLQTGCGGLCGSITLDSYASDGCLPLLGGSFVIAATDMGHDQNDPSSWGLDSQKRADFAYRAQHITSLAARRLIKSFYGQNERYSYFNGCSDGGREALMTVQRYPRDFDGVIAGAPAMLFQVQNTLFHGWLARSNMDTNDKAILLSGKLPVLHQAVMDACDTLDGVKDGIIASPAACKFNPQSIECAVDAADTTNCLTTAEVQVVQKIYAGPKDDQARGYLTAGQPLYGSELNWKGVYVPDSPEQPLFSTFIVLPVLQYLAFMLPMPEFTIQELQFTNQTLDALRARHPFFDATNTKIEDFVNDGRKLILWHGLADPHISPSNTVSYYNALVRDLGRDKVDKFLRMYLVPGMSHCMGGDGLNTLDLLSAMIAWVEEGKAPTSIIASNAAKPIPPGPPPKEFENIDLPDDLSVGLPNMTRPLYPYPITSKYTGQGSIYDATNWKQGPSVEYVPTRSWLGGNLFGRYDFIDRT